MYYLLEERQGILQLWRACVDDSRRFAGIYAVAELKGAFLGSRNAKRCLYFFFSLLRKWIRGELVWGFGGKDGWGRWRWRLEGVVVS